MKNIHWKHTAKKIYISKSKHRNVLIFVFFFFSRDLTRSPTAKKHDRSQRFLRLSQPLTRRRTKSARFPISFKPTHRRRRWRDWALRRWSRFFDGRSESRRISAATSGDDTLVLHQLTGKLINHSVHLLKTFPIYKFRFSEIWLLRFRREFFLSFSKSVRFFVYYIERGKWSEP